MKGFCLSKSLGYASYFKQVSQTCRQRKVKCDEGRPVCQQCAKTGRYCNRTEQIAKFVNKRAAATQKQFTKFPLPSDTRNALCDQRIALLLQHYLVIADWYDLCDPARRFSKTVCHLALHNELLFSAVIALAAMHFSITQSKSTRLTAEFYHDCCVQLLIDLHAENHQLRDGTALAAVCLLRSYEILDEDVDPNRHLQGAFSLATASTSLENIEQSSLIAAGYWNYLREDITFSLFEGCQLKLDTSNFTPPSFLELEESNLHSASLILARIINSCFGAAISRQKWLHFNKELDSWYDNLPQTTHPYSEQPSETQGLPKIWFLEDHHASAMQYFLLSCSLLCVHAPSNNISNLYIPGDLDNASVTKEGLLDCYALRICGIAFTTNIPAVLVNAFGPISYCAKHIKNKSAQEEVTRRLLACKKIIGWPVERLVKDLQEAWATV